MITTTDQDRTIRDLAEAGMITRVTPASPASPAAADIEVYATDTGEEPVARWRVYADGEAQPLGADGNTYALRPLTREQAWWAGEAPLCDCGEPLDGYQPCPACGKQPPRPDLEPDYDERGNDRHADDRAALAVLTELTGEWVTTLHVATVADFATPGPMGDDGRYRALRALRRLEHDGVAERRDLPSGNYHWRHPEPEPALTAEEGAAIDADIDRARNEVERASGGTIGTL